MPRRLNARATRRPRRAMRRPRRKTGRLYKSTVQHSSFKSQGLPKELSVKAPFFAQAAFPIPESGNSPTRVVLLGNSLNPLPASLQGVVGSSPSSTTTLTGDILVPGHTEYSGFYGTSLCTCSSWALRFTNASTTGLTTVVVCAVPYEGDLTTGAQPSELTARIAELDAISFDSVCAQPYAKVFNLNAQTSGHETRTFKFTRSTKKMIGVKDIKDRVALASESLPLIDGQLLPSEGWFLYIRTNTNAVFGQGYPIQLQIKGTVYTHLTSRAPLPLETAA